MVLTVKPVIAAAVLGSAGVVLAATGGVLPATWLTIPPAPQTPPSVSLTATPPATEDRSAEYGASVPPLVFEGRQCQHGCAVGVVADAPGGLDAVHLAHAEVHDDHVCAGGWIAAAWGILMSYGDTLAALGVG